MKTGAAPAHRTGQPKSLVALAGNPNSGKTTVFNALTGLRHKVGNYAGVTVDKKSGPLRGARDSDWEVLDLPGTYSLTARSPEETIARQVLLGELEDTPQPDLIVVVIDASNLERNLYLAVQILDMGLPAIVALNMWDLAEKRHIIIDAEALAAGLGTTAVPMVASRGEGLEELRRNIEQRAVPDSPARRWVLGDDHESSIASLAEQIGETTDWPRAVCDMEAIRLIGVEAPAEDPAVRDRAELIAAVEAARQSMRSAGLEPATVEAESRYRWIRALTRNVVERPSEQTTTPSDRIDVVLTHRVAGPIIFVALMALIFQAIFAWASYPMDLIGTGIALLAGLIGGLMSDGPFRGLLVDGALAGVGAVLVFLPQILFIFFFIGLLEDTGYMARAAFMMDRVMRRCGLHGKAFIPLLSSYACAIPGIMSARTIENDRDRLVTVLVAPLMTCSARLPVYTILIAAFIPGSAVVKGLTLTSLYLLGALSAIGVAFVLKRTVLSGETPALILELPPYRLPSIKSVLLNMWDQTRMFLQRAGTIILGVSILLWFLMAYPSPPPQGVAGTDDDVVAVGARPVRNSFAGTLGRAMEPIIEPLGFDWRIGVGIIASFAAREVFVSAMGTIYAVGGDVEGATLKERLADARWESGDRVGQPVFTLASTVALLVFYVFALQCVSTIAVMRRETNSWKWPAFAWAYMAALAYFGAWIAYTVVDAFV